MGDAPEPDAPETGNPRSRLPCAFGLPRARRVRKRADFVRIQNGKLRVTTRNLLLLLGAAPGGVSRLGVVASRKVGGAVERNRCKRLVRDAFRQHPEAVPRGVDLVVVVRPGTHLLAASVIAAEIVGAAHELERRARELRARGAAENAARTK